MPVFIVNAKTESVISFTFISSLMCLICLVPPQNAHFI